MPVLIVNYKFTFDLTCGVVDVRLKASLLSEAALGGPMATLNMAGMLDFTVCWKYFLDHRFTVD